MKIKSLNYHLLSKEGSLWEVVNDFQVGEGERDILDFENNLLVVGHDKRIKKLFDVHL